MSSSEPRPSPPVVTAPRLRFVSREWWPRPGGIARQLDTLASLTLARGAPVGIWTGTRDRRGATDAPVHRSPAGTRPLAVYGSWLAGALAADGLVNARRPAVTVVAGSSLETAIVLALGRRLRGRAVVYLAGGGRAGSDFRSLRRGWLRRLILARADAIIVHTPSYAEEIRAAGPRGELHVVPTLTGRRNQRCPVQLHSRSPAPTVRAVWCGRDHPIKNLAGLARLSDGAFADAGIQVDLVIDRVPAAGFAPDRIHVGCVDPRSHFADADIAVLTSGHESLPNVLAEAALEGVPLVAYAVGGIPEALAALGHGATVAADASDQEFAARVRAVALDYRDPRRRAALRARAEAFFGSTAEQVWLTALGLDRWGDPVTPAPSASGCP